MNDGADSEDSSVEDVGYQYEVDSSHDYWV